jgi:hypothetical protein
MREMGNAYRSWLEILNVGDRFEDPRVDEGITLKSILKKYGGGSVHWIRLAQETALWRTLVNTAVKHHVS